MAAVTQRVSNYLSGVSKQADSQKIPGQVRECINGLPDMTLGMTKRPGFKFISKLKNTSGTDFSYGSNWTANTAYSVGDQVQNDDGKIYKCDTAGTSAGSGGPTGTGSDITDNTARWDYINTSLDNAKWFYINRDTTTQYIGCITPKIGSTNGSIHIWNAGTGAACTITYPNNGQDYLTGAKTNYDILTVQDTTIISNDLITITTQAAPTGFVAASRGTLLLTGKIEQMQGETFSVTVAGSTTASYTAANDADFDEILTNLKTKIDDLSISGLTVTKYGTSLQLDRVVSSTRTTFTLSASGGDDNERLVVFQDWASNVSYLPPNSFHGHVVEIVNNVKFDEDNYFAKFVADNGAAGSGYWEETIDPQVSPGLTASTMPHELVNTGATTFTFSPMTWTDRKVGDDLTNDHPSFVGKTISKAFWHDDRLGFLSEDNVILSHAKLPRQFYHASAKTIANGDPIDISCASLRPTKLHAIKPVRQGLVLFSTNQQFLLYADDGPLTPGSSKIRPISNMEMSEQVDPIDVGTNINFISKTPNFVRVFAMQTKGLGENPEIVDIGKSVNEWITIDVDTLIASIQNEFIAMSSQASNEIYFYKTYTRGQDRLMESWFKWRLPGTVQGMTVDQDDMFCVTKQGNQYTLSSANLTQSPEVSIITNADGQKINPCIDLYAQASSVVYDSTNDFSKCYIPYANLTDEKNVLIVSGTTAAGTFNNSGFTITPETDTDGTGTYFKVPGQNLTSVASNVYVGYVYNFDLTLPRIYYKLDDDGRINDFTSSLTVSRLKFDVGLSGVLGFKLNAVGRFAGKKEYTGDNSTTDFDWIKADLDYVDRNQVKVKVNNKTSTAWSFQTDTKIRFSSAPSTGDKIVIYLDEWYTLQPVTPANTYLADDVALNESTVFTIPIHQRSKNFKLRVFNDSPFPVSLNSMMWEGNYSPRFYRRT